MEISKAMSAVPCSLTTEHACQFLFKSKPKAANASRKSLILCSEVTDFLLGNTSDQLNLSDLAVMVGVCFQNQIIMRGYTQN